MTPPVSQVSWDAAEGLLLGPIAMDESVDVTDEESCAGNANDGQSRATAAQKQQKQHRSNRSNTKPKGMETSHMKAPQVT